MGPLRNSSLIDLILAALPCKGSVLEVRIGSSGKVKPTPLSGECVEVFEVALRNINVLEVSFA
jgi:hypothetical protein